MRNVADAIAGSDCCWMSKRVVRRATPRLPPDAYNSHGGGVTPSLIKG
jgi:hypothetical protein